MSEYNKYVISVCSERYDAFMQYMNDLDQGHIYKLPTKITKNKHWIGAGLSHQDCVRHAMENRSPYAMVFEDDCRFMTGYEPVLNSVIEFINKNNDWEYIGLSHTFLHKIGAMKRNPNIDIANFLAAESRFHRVSDYLIEVNLSDLQGPVIGNSCCVIYNNTVYKKYLNEFDPYTHEWCDVWSPKNLKTLIAAPGVAYQHGKPWQKVHCKTWNNFISNIK